MNVAIIYGGRSGEHEISLISAASIAREISKKHNVILIGITKTGKWFLQDESELNRINSQPKSPLKIEENEENSIVIVPAGRKKLIKNNYKDS